MAKVLTAVFRDFDRYGRDAMGKKKQQKKKLAFQPWCSKRQRPARLNFVTQLRALTVNDAVLSNVEEPPPAEAEPDWRNCQGNIATSLDHL